MRAARRDKVLSDDEWAQIAHDAMNRTGLSPYGEEDDAVRWIAVRHGDGRVAGAHCCVPAPSQPGVPLVTAPG